MNIYLEKDTWSRMGASYGDPCKCVMRYGRFTSQAQIDEWEKQTGEKMEDWRIVEAEAGTTSSSLRSND